MFCSLEHSELTRRHAVDLTVKTPWIHSTSQRLTDPIKSLLGTQRVANKPRSAQHTVPVDRAYSFRSKRGCIHVFYRLDNTGLNIKGGELAIVGLQRQFVAKSRLLPKRSTSIQSSDGILKAQDQSQPIEIAVTAIEEELERGG